MDVKIMTTDEINELRKEIQQRKCGLELTYYDIKEADSNTLVGDNSSQDRKMIILFYLCAAVMKECLRGIAEGHGMTGRRLECGRGIYG